MFRWTIILGELLPSPKQLTAPSIKIIETFFIVALGFEDYDSERYVYILI